jgi:hypothetical protein
MTSPRRLLVLGALAVAVAALAFAGGRATRADAPARAEAPRLERVALEVELPPLAVGGRVPALKAEKSEPAPTEAERALAPVDRSPPQVSASPPPSASPPSNGAPDEPTVVGGGTE